MSDTTLRSQKSIAASGAALLFSQHSLMALNIVFTVYLLRVLPKVEVAVVAVFDILIAIFGFSDLGLMSVVTQQAPAELRSGGDWGRALTLIKCTLRYQTMALFAIGAGVILLAPTVSTLFLKTPDYAWAVVLFVPGAVAYIWFSFLQGVAQVSQDFFLIARWNFVAGVSRQVVSILGYFAFGFPGYLIGIVLSTFIPVVGMGRSLQRFLFNDVPAAPFWETFRYGLPFYLRGFMRYGFMQFDQALVGALLAPGALAAYSVARRFASYIYMMINAFQTPIGIRMAALRQDAREDQAAFFSQATRYTTLITIPLCVAVAAASPWLMSMYGGAKYAGDWPMLALLALAQAGYAIYTVYGGAVFAHLPPRATLLVDSVVGGINYLVAPVLILVMAQYGIAWGQLIGFAAGVPLCRFLLRQIPELEYDWSSLRTISSPLLLAVLLPVWGQIFYFRLWIVPLYFLVAGGLFILTIRSRLSERDWAQLRALVPARWLRVVNRVHELASSALRAS